jgi:hypothetical protein
MNRRNKTPSHVNGSFTAVIVAGSVLAAERSSLVVGVLVAVDMKWFLLGLWQEG